MAVLNKQTLLAFASSISPVRFDIPNSATDEHVYLKPLTAGEREEYENTITGADKDDTCVRATFLSHVVCDSTGKLLFTPEDIPEINKMPNSIIYPMFYKANEINGLLTTAVDDAEKN